MPKTSRLFAVALFGMAEIVLVSFLSPPLVRAETVAPRYITADTVWDPSGSPYLLYSDVDVQAGAILRVLPGTKIMLPEGHQVQTIAVYGALSIEGSSTDSVDITGIDGITILGGSVSASYLYMHGGPAFHAVGGSIVISSSVIEDANGSAFLMNGGTLNADNIRIDGSSAYGVLATPFSPNQPAVIIRNSSLVNNSIKALYNSSSATVHAEQDWWGDAGGPKPSGANSIQGKISVAPWLPFDPTESLLPRRCCSSVLFIPGMEGTRMYDSSGRLWEPLRNLSVKKLYLDDNGSSTDLSTFSGGPIDSAYGLKDIYGKFLDFLDGLTGDGSINEWRAFGYDWRKPIEQVVAGEEKKATTTETLMGDILAMASTSKTGKVTLVAHSNGGLVAKYLVKSLAEVGKAALIDSVISVAVPYVGTPEAIAALLHGDHQSILAGLLVSKSTARGLGQNMPSAYSLLPSAAFFTKILKPVIAFASSTTKGLNDGSYPQEIVSAVGQSDFILDTHHVRMDPSLSDVTDPLIGNGALFHAAEALHNILDIYEWPIDMARWSIIGWNAETTEGVKYYEKQGCDSFIGRLWCGGSSIFHKLLTSIMGDGTVLAPSAAYDSGQAVSVDLAAASVAERTGISHANILEASSTQSIVRQIITGRNPKKSVPKIGGAKLGEPDYSAEPGFLAVSVRSSAALDIYDSQGRHTGLTTKPSTLVDNDFVFGAYEEGIPGSHFQQTGDGVDAYTYIKLPGNSADTYSVKVSGGGFGFFTFGIEKSSGVAGPPEEETVYETMPMSPLTVATTTIENDEPPPALHVDIEGNGSPDYESAPGGNGLPGNAATIADAQKIAQEQSIMLIEKTDTPEMAADPRRQEFMEQVYPNGTGAKAEQAPTPPSSTQPQKTPPGGGVDCEPK